MKKFFEIFQTCFSVHLVWEERGKKLRADFHKLHPDVASSVLSPTAYRILQSLEEPKTLTDLAQELSLTPQAVLYHLKKLLRSGSVTKFPDGSYVRSADAYGVILKGREVAPAHVPRAIEEFFSPFAEGGMWRATIVVGVPDPHGYYLQRARDGHYVGVLGFFLGRYFSFKGFPVRVDTDVSYLWRERDLVLIGGPVSNTVTFELVEETGLFFDPERPWSLKGKKLHTEGNVGLVAKVEHGGRWYLLLAGISALGTKASILALSGYWESLLPSYPGGEYYWIVQGVDVNGDGEIDTITVLEHGVPRKSEK